METLIAVGWQCLECTCEQSVEASYFHLHVTWTQHLDIYLRAVPALVKVDASYPVKNETCLTLQVVLP